MGVYLPNVDMPKDDKAVTIQICPDGSIWQQYRGTVPNAKAVPIPTPHGDLIDRAALRAEVNKHATPSDAWVFSLIRTAPTIIPAEEGE